MPPPMGGRGGGEMFEPKIYLFIQKQACMPKINSVDQFWGENYIYSYIKKGEMPPPPTGGRVGEWKCLNLKSIFL